jgi:hypothetical protein
MRRAFVVLPLVMNLLWIGSLRAQGGYGGLLFGSEWVKVDALNAKMDAAGYQAFSDAFPAFGGWGAFIGKHVLIGGCGWGIWQTRQSPDATARLSAGLGFFDLGYVVRSGKMARLTALTGIGGGGFEMEITPAQMERDFEQILQNPRVLTRISSGQLVVKLGFQLDHTVWMEKGASQGAAVLLGIRAEYLFPLGDMEWETDGTQLYRMPELDLKGPHVKLIVGFGGGAQR